MGKMDDKDIIEDIDAIVDMIDCKLSGGVGRLKISVSKETDPGTVTEVYHHGRCDVGSPWARGTVRNSDSCD